MRVLDCIVHIGDRAQGIVDGRTIDLVVIAIALEGNRSDPSLRSFAIDVPDDVVDALAGVVFHARST